MLPPAPSSLLNYGKAIHKAVEIYLNTWKEDDSIISNNKLLQIFDSSFDYAGMYS